MNVEDLTPILNVSDLAASFAWFKKWGWKKLWDWGTPPTFGAVGSGNSRIFLCLDGQGGRGRGDNRTTFQQAGDQQGDKGSWMSVWIDDVDAAHTQCVAAGLDITCPPTDMPWHVREMHLRHPDGHVFRVSCGLRNIRVPLMKAAHDPYNLQRFVDAQEPVIAGVLAELKHGRKRGHWIWFIFPQLKGLGRSSTAQFYGISSLAEAIAYLKHPVLGQRLVQCTELVNAVEGSDTEDIFGEIDAMKFRSCMSLFARADPGNHVFADALEKYFAGDPDLLTTSHLDKPSK